MDQQVLIELRQALRQADYTHDTVVGQLGELAHNALGRNETTPAIAATAAGSPLETLIRLFLLQQPVPAAALNSVLADVVSPLLAAQLLTADGGQVRALVELRPYQVDNTTWWLFGDPIPGLDGQAFQLPADYVLGVNPAANQLASVTVPRQGGRALDLGSGCGIQTLHLASRGAAVVATDLNPRATWMTRLNAMLNGFDVDARTGDLWQPVAGEKFDQIVTNPPFVISPGAGAGLMYRDSGLAGDQMVERVVAGLAPHLVPGGWGQVVANWAIYVDHPWDERLAEWLPSDTDAWVVQREVLDVAQYVELWLKDSGHHGAPDYTARYDQWLSWLQAEGIEAVGFGWVHLRAGGSGHHHVEQWHHQIQSPIGEFVPQHFVSRQLAAQLDDTTLTNLRLRCRDDVRQETFGAPGAADPEQVVLRQHRYMCRARLVSTWEAALVGACDGELTVGQIMAALDDILGSGQAEAGLESVRELMAEGFLLPT